MKTFRFHYLLLLFLSYTSVGFAQFSFEKIIRSEDSEVFVDAFEDQEGNYICIGSKQYQTGFHNNTPIIYKFNLAGELISSKEIQKADTNAYFEFGFQKMDGNYLLMGTMGDTITPFDYDHAYICELDQDLEIIFEKYYQIPVPFNSYSNENYFISSDQKIVIQGKADSVLYSFNNQLVLSIFDMEGNLLNFIMPVGWKDYSHSGDMIEKLDGSGFYLICEFNENYSPRDWVEVDYELNIVDYGFFESSWNAAIAPASIVWLQNNNLFMANYSHDNQTGDTGDLLVRIFDQDFNTLKDTIIHYDEQMCLPVHNGVDITSENNIWVCAFDVSLPPNAYGTADFYVHIFNPEMELLGTKIFGGDMRYYLYDLTATSDGGCMIVGMVPNFEGSNIVDAYMIKMMPEDVITGIETPSRNNDKNISISPNPFQDILYVKSPDNDVILTLYTSFGLEVLIKNIPVNRQVSILTSNLKTGVYFYTLKNKNGIFETGKLIKN